MSRLGKQPISVPAGTEVTVQDTAVTVKGTKGTLQQQLHPLVSVALAEGEGGKEVRVSVRDANNKEQRALWGLYRMLIQNMVTGVNTPFEKKLEVNGVGYKASVSGNTLTLSVGYSHPVTFNAPEGVSITVEKNSITVSGIDKQLVGESAANIRKVRKPEPYKGKGIKYVDEVIRRKAGKTAAAAG